ncbi:hypothetical protein XH80_26610 [Bradyrhizobium sp. CCBAU 45384]|nr:hypothetical protein [Bradyrhizobium sp. CCBAU 45384]
MAKVIARQENDDRQVQLVDLHAANPIGADRRTCIAVGRRFNAVVHTVILGAGGRRHEQGPSHECRCESYTLRRRPRH